MNINLDSIDTVVLTHGHSDHINGVPFLSRSKKIIMHPQAFKERYSIRKKEYVVFQMAENELREQHEVILSREAIEVFVTLLNMQKRLRLNREFMQY